MGFNRSLSAVKESIQVDCEPSSITAVMCVPPLWPTALARKALKRVPLEPCVPYVAVVDVTVQPSLCGFWAHCPCLGRVCLLADPDCSCVCGLFWADPDCQWFCGFFCADPDCHWFFSPCMMVGCLPSHLLQVDGFSHLAPVCPGLMHL